MPDALRPLLAGMLDYAGLFPPAALPLEAAVSNWRRYQNEPAAWLLRRFVCPVARLADLRALNWSQPDGAVSLLVAGGRSNADILQNLADAREAVESFPNPNLVDTFELQWPTDWLADDNSSSSADHLKRVDDAIPQSSPTTMFFEFPAAEAMSESTFRDRLTTTVAAFADFNRKARHRQMGFKFRTGGTTPSAIPSPSRFAAVIAACRDAGVFWKATGGLHDPWRHVDPSLGVAAHGFVNVLAAASFATAKNLDAATLEAILSDDRPDHFRIDDATLTWRNHTVTADQIAAARTSAFRSFGSCSFDEPRQHLEAYGWL